MLQTTTTLPDMQYAGYYAHPRSGLLLTVHRAYLPPIGRFINRDPVEESGGINLYAYVNNKPVSLTDSLGLAPGNQPLRIVPNPSGESAASQPFQYPGTSGTVSEAFLMKAIKELDPTGSADDCLSEYDEVKAGCNESFGPDSIQHQVKPCPIAYQNCLTGAVIGLLNCLKSVGVDPGLAWGLGQEKQAVQQAMDSMRAQWDAIRRFKLW